MIQPVECYSSKVVWKDSSYHLKFVVVGTKGDWPFLRSAYSLAVGFNCTDKCHRCDTRESESDEFKPFFVPYQSVTHRNYIRIRTHSTRQRIMGIHCHGYISTLSVASPSCALASGMVGCEGRRQDLGSVVVAPTSVQTNYAESS